MSNEDKLTYPAERIPEIFEAALEFDAPEARAGYLDEACAGDSNLRAEIERLLARHDEAEVFFEDSNPTQISAEEITRTLIDISKFFEATEPAESGVSEIGQQIDEYKLLRKIGEGGVGIVYLAEQLKPVHREVALKVIKAGMDTKSVIARFEAERQALAMMQHPNIASVLHAGETGTGRPYFVMEVVHGEKITTYCDENGLEIHKRLELFMQVCHAVQHAHQKGIIHRDIKPSNVLITSRDGAARPVVIDFGIAKATGENLLTDKTVNTSMGPIIGTPVYMSPEQTNLHEALIDTRSDIYSLGVLLYELLVSQTPFDRKELVGAGLDGMCRILREQEPLPLAAKFRHLDATEQLCIAKARGVETHRLGSILAKDLEWITIKAMEKARERRYQSAGELAAEVQRFIKHEPVLAGPPSRAYRFRKLVRRNKAASISVAAISLTIIACLAASSWLYLKERDARKRAVTAERQEQQLRIQAENRERLTQAAYLISMGDLEAADRIVDSVSTAAPSLEAESVLRTLGQWHALEGRWADSAARFKLLLQADIKNSSWTITDDLLKAGPVLIENGDVEGYENFRRAAIAAYRTTEGYTFAERTLKVSLLLPVNQQTLDSLQSIEAVLTEANRDVVELDGMRAWGAMSLALMAYREGDWESAIDWSIRCRNSVDRHQVRMAMTHFVQAMAASKLGDTDKAKAHLRLGQVPVEAAFARPMSVGTHAEGFWYDWIYARIIMREAESLIQEPYTGSL